LFCPKKHKNLKNKSFDFLLEQTFARASSSKTFARALSLQDLVGLKFEQALARFIFLASTHKSHLLDQA
jgi:hypothetical protein